MVMGLLDIFMLITGSDKAQYIEEQAQYLI